MIRSRKKSAVEPTAREKRPTPAAEAEEILEKQLDDIVTILCKTGKGKSRVYEEILAMVERSLVRIALRRSKNVKSTAAAYLGINRNTLQKKMIDFGINNGSE
jgi:Fis family transcriptional regulator